MTVFVVTESEKSIVPPASDSTFATKSRTVNVTGATAGTEKKSAPIEGSGEPEPQSKFTVASVRVSL